MRLRTVFTGIIGVALGTAPGAAQLRANRPSSIPQNLPRQLVANPHSFSSQDSTASVRVGAGMRDKIEDISDRWYKTLTRAQMNEALQQYAYPIDAVLPPMVARQLATSLNARAVVISTILKDPGGRYAVEARLTGISDDAGQMVRVSQNPNESFEAFGARIGEALETPYKALVDAKACQNQSKTSPDKARESAAKALKVLPTSGLAHYCLAQISVDKKAPIDTIISHLKLATQGDPLSLPAMTMLAVQYQAKKDTTATLEAFKQLLRIAPTNEALRKEAFGLFQRYGRPDAAEEVADEGIKLDPVNADVWDLKFGACIAQERPEKNKCAIEALEQVFVLDSTKADTTFFTKITYATSRPIRIDTLHLSRDSSVKVTRDSLGVKLTRDSVVAKVNKDTVVSTLDTARFLKWARRGVAKYPNNAILIGQLTQAYSLAGPLDSAVSVTKRLMSVDSSDVSPVLRVTLALKDAKRGREILDLAPYIERLGGPEDKQNMGSILSQAAFSYIQPPADYPLAADLARATLRFAQPGSPTARFANFTLGLSIFTQMAALDTEAAAQKSCPLAQQMKAMLADAVPALEAGRSINEAVIAARLQAVDPFTKRIDSLIKAYCK